MYLLSIECSFFFQHWSRSNDVAHIQFMSSNLLIRLYVYRKCNAIRSHFQWIFGHDKGTTTKKAPKPSKNNIVNTKSSWNERFISCKPIQKHKDTFFIDISVSKCNSILISEQWIFQYKSPNSMVLWNVNQFSNNDQIEIDWWQL